MIYKNKIGVLILSLLVLFCVGCENDYDYYDDDEIIISQFGDDESHKTGQNCMDCHTVDGSGEGQFSIAGTIYHEDQITPYENVTVKLYSQADIVEIILEVDANGNFYTNEIVDWGDGLFPSVLGETEEQKMIQSVNNGACNECHDGTTTPRIFSN
ncbi:MAG: hypothetical protein H8E71_09645 [Candidatus Marinimicrobia bacterium]|nr:hypothetical protein [Candidatus Neomarinimicrobiota bacterium]MBL7109768.1 hypothetical protein [Candidatus Neomarinimicrobiota bacterium]